MQHNLDWICTDCHVACFGFLQFFFFASVPSHFKYLAVFSWNFMIWAALWQNQQSDCAPTEDSDQFEHPPSLIRVFAVRKKKYWVIIYPLSAQWRLWSDCADALGWSESSMGAHSFCRFCHVVAHFYYGICYNFVAVVNQQPATKLETHGLYLIWRGNGRENQLYAMFKMPHAKWSLHICWDQEKTFLLSKTLISV